MSALNQQLVIKDNFKKLIKTSVFVLIPTVFLWGCESTPEQPDSGTAATEIKVDSGANSSGANVGGSSTAKPMRSDSNPAPTANKDLLSNRTIYFEFDKNDISQEYREIIKAHAEYLANNPSSKITIEGNADERGTREYNIGLGDRRANAVRQIMVLQGATSNQVDTISYGEERPAQLGHDESSWDKNRRAEIVYSSR